MSRKNKRLSRRAFLRKGFAAGGLFALPFIVPASVFGEYAPSNRIGIGIIGTGGQGILNLKGFLHKPDAQAIAVCDVDYSHREQARKIGRLPENASYNDFRELVARQDVDAVVVCTPDQWHSPISILAAKAGKDIYCEKPVAFNIAEGRILSDTVKKYNRVIQAGTQQRSDNKFRLACQLVRNGRIGKLHTIKVELPQNSRPNPLSWKVEPPPADLDYDLWLGPAQYRPYIKDGCHYNWHFIYDFGWGQLTNWGSHALDIAQWGNGSDLSGPIEVIGKAEFPTEGLFDTPLDYDIEYKYSNGVRLLCKTAKGKIEESPVRFEGTEGWIYVSRSRLISQPESIVQSIFRHDEIRLYESKDHHKNFIDCIKTRAKPAADIETAHRSASVCHIGGIAVRLGRKLQWDPVNEKFVNDSEANKMLARPMRSPWNV